MAENQKNNRTLPENKIKNTIDFQYKELTSKRNVMFSILVFLLNICAIIVGYMWISHNEKVANFNIVFDSSNSGYWVLVVSCLLLIVLITSFSKFLGFYAVTKKRKFLTLFTGQIKSSYYDCVSLYNKGWIVGCKHLINKADSSDHSINTILSSRMSDRFAKLVYSFIVLLSCSIFCIRKINLIVYLLGIASFIVLTIVFVFVLMLKYKPSKILAIVAWFSAVLYKCKVVRDYEAYYNFIVGKMNSMNLYFKQKNYVAIIQFFANITVYILKALILYLFMLSINMGGIGTFAEMLIRLVLIDLIIEVLPLPKGVLVYEVLFILLFKNIMLEGFLFWGLIVYRMFDVIIYFILNVVISIVENIFHKKKNKYQKC